MLKFFRHWGTVINLDDIRNTILIHVYGVLSDILNLK